MKEAPSGAALQDIIQAVRDLVKDEQGETGLVCPTTDQFLLRFIKASQYDVQTSFRLIKRYFSAKVENPEAFIVQSPAGNLKMLQRKDLGLPLKNKDKCGRRVLNIKFGLFDPRRETWKNVVESAMMILEAFSLEEDVQDTGVAMILDCESFSLKIMKWMTPHKIKTALAFFQDCIPLRFEVIHVINYPYIFNVFFSALGPFLHEEVKRKLVFHNTLSSLEQYIDKPLLPVDLGGQLAPEEVENWYQLVLDKEEIFEEFRKMGYPETLSKLKT